MVMYISMLRKLKMTNELALYSLKKGDKNTE